ncbi:hypothetical protein B6V76_08260 [Thioclava sp. IC9]|nr:hypothetical protein B6V76_08260 [Thioclava sp. IC9]
MDRPEGAGLQRAHWVDYDPHMWLEYRSTQFNSDDGLLVMGELDDALGLSYLAITTLRATVMRMTAIYEEAKRKRQDRFDRCTEKHRPWATTQRLPGPIRPVPAACATADAAQGEKRLSSGVNQAVLTSDSRPLRECRMKDQ